MSPTQIQSYFDAIQYFDENFDPQSKDQIALKNILDQLHATWPNTSITLAEQGFFLSMLQLN